MKRCNHCLSKPTVESETCPVCGIESTKKKKDLAVEEIKTRRAARNVLGVALAHLILASVGVGALLLAQQREQIPESFLGELTILLTCYFILLLTAFGLSRYAYWAYKLTTTFYFLIGIMFTISVQIPQALLILVLLYLIGNKYAKSIFDRGSLQ